MLVFPVELFPKLVYRVSFGVQIILRVELSVSSVLENNLIEY